MILDRNKPGGVPKYALIPMRKVMDCPNPRAVKVALDTLRANGLLDVCDDPETEFFVIRLRDANAAAALSAYAHHAIENGDMQYAVAVSRLAEKAADHPHSRQPD